MLGESFNLDVIRFALSEVVGPDGTPLVAPDEVTSVVQEGDWLIVVLGKEGASAELLARVHERLKQRFPTMQVELRAPGKVYRGGVGFGAGRHVVAVLGGKGGVGKSTVSVNLALTLAAMGFSVGILDGDIQGPDIPHLLGVHPNADQGGYGWQLASTRITPPSRRPRPYDRFGLEVMSVGFVIPERVPPTVTGRGLISSLLRYLIFDIAWSANVLVVDAPPGTGDEIQVIARELPLSGAVFVTTPQDLAQMDAERTLTLLNEAGVPVIGVVQNMAWLTCPHCDQPIDMFAQSSRLTDAGVRVLGHIPFDVRLSVTADRGLPLVFGDPRGPVAQEFARIGGAVRRWLAEKDTSGG